jgi:hypothetical protein
MAVTNNLWTVLSSILWGAGALFAVSLALIVSGVTVLVMMCLLMLADLSNNWDGNAFGQVLLLHGETAMNREFSSDRNANLRRMPDTFLHRSNLSDGRFSDWHIPMHSTDDRANEQIARSRRSPPS